MQAKTASAKVLKSTKSSKPLAGKKVKQTSHSAVLATWGFDGDEDSGGGDLAENQDRKDGQLDFRPITRSQRYIWDSQFNMLPEGVQEQYRKLSSKDCNIRLKLIKALQNATCTREKSVKAGAEIGGSLGVALKRLLNNTTNRRPATDQHHHFLNQTSRGHRG